LREVPFIHAPKEKFRMKFAIVLGFLAVSTLAQAGGENGFYCHVQKTTRPGILNGFSDSEISPDLSHAGMSRRGEVITISRAELEGQALSPIVKQFSSDDFEGSVQVSVRLINEGGKAIGSAVTVAYLSQGKTRTSANVESSFGGTPTKIELPVGRGGLLSATVECKTW